MVAWIVIALKFALSAAWLVVCFFAILSGAVTEYSALVYFVFLSGPAMFFIWAMSYRLLEIQAELMRIRAEIEVMRAQSNGN